MTKGTPSRGKHQKTAVILCRRCGHRSYNISKRHCSSCGFGVSPKIRKYAWQTKTVNKTSHRLM
ncbi:MAG: 50S ribosomal protein L37e [Candidatus Bathyarchaeota archaeon]